MRHVLAVLAFFTAGAAAAQPPATASQTRPAPPPDGSTVTVTGCLGKGDAPGSFVLNNVQWKVAGAPAKSASAHHEGTSQGEPPKAPATATSAAGAVVPGETLRLAGAAAKLKIDAHLGHTISATGMVAAHDPVVAPGVVLPPAPRGNKASPGASEPKEPPLPRILNVRSFSHVAPDCK